MSLESRVENTSEPNRTNLKLYIRHKALAGLSDTTIENYVNRIFQFLKWCGNKDLMQIERADIEEYIMAQMKNEKPGTVNFDLRSLKSVLGDLRGKSEMVRLTKDIHIKIPQRKIRDDELLSDEEIKKMISLARTERDRALIAVLYASGCRRSEFLGIRLRDVTFTQYGVSIHVNGKTGERDIDMYIGVQELRAWYNVHPYRDDPDAPLWVSNRGEALKRHGLTHTIERLAERAGVSGKRIYPHAFRHKRATDCAQFMTATDMKEFLGWSVTSDMVSVYTHSSRDTVNEKLMRNAGIEAPVKRKESSLVNKVCKVCGMNNSPVATICMACASPLDEGLSRADNEYQEYLREHAAELLAWKAEKDKAVHIADVSKKV